MRRTIAAIAAIALLAGCTSSAQKPAGSGGASPTAPATDNTGVVDGITIPPPYIKPPGTVVPGPATCPAPFTATLNAAAGGGTFSQTSQSTAHLITCRYHDAQAAAGHCSAAIILVNTEAQAFMAFDRWNVETGQNSMWGNDPKTRPTPVDGLGVEAEWVPKLLELGTANNTTWISVILTCPANTPPVLALAKHLAREGFASTA
jgi:hypothetical protein